VTAAELSAQIAKMSAAFGDTALMSAAREGLEQAQGGIGQLMSTPEIQQIMAGVERRRREAARLEEARRLEEATLALDRARRSRLRRIFLTWGHHGGSEEAPAEKWKREAGEHAESGACPAGSPPFASETGLADYLENAHRHPAIARPKPSGVREWFKDWRALAIAALREGLSAGEVAAIVLAAPGPKEALTRLPVPDAARPTFDWLRERSADLARPNAPDQPRPKLNPVTGGAPVATIA
jgi:hypothetical protein